MLRATAMLAILAIPAGLSVAFADPPATPETPSTVAAKPAPKPPEEKSDERVLRDEGFKPQMRNGEMVWCRRESPLGTRLTTQLKCITVEESKLIAEEGRRTAERIQRGQTGCLATGTARGPSTGPANCGN